MDKLFFCDEGLDISLNHHLECVRFCFTGLLQVELDETVQLWNNHRIRSVRNSESPAGWPDVLFFAPQLSNGRNYKFPINNNDIATAGEFTSPLLLSGCSPEMEAFAKNIMDEKQLEFPTNPERAKNLFWTLVDEIDSIV